MELDMKYEKGIGVIRIAGELDAQTAPQLTRFFEEHYSENSVNYVADLQDLAYSSSAGIRIFLGLARNLRQNNGDLRIGGVQPQVDKIFKLSKFDKIVKIFPAVSDAVNSYKPS
jgi:anti-sigma B factor antagonist